MRAKALAACRKNGSMCLLGVPKRCMAFFLEEFGRPEEIWELEVDKFTAMVTIDNRDESHHAKVAAAREKYWQ